MFTSNREALRELVVRLAIRRGPITLSNGSVSAYYFDCKRLTLDSDGAAEVSVAMTEVIAGLSPRPLAIGGLSLGADPIIGPVMMQARRQGIKLQGFYVRKTAKQHGTKSFIENEPAAGAPIAIVDDVITTGKSAIDAIDRAEAIGGRIVAVLAIVDRLEGGTQRIQDRVPYAKYIPLFTLNDFPEIERLRHECSTNSEALSATASI